LHVNILKRKIALLGSQLNYFPKEKRKNRQKKKKESENTSTLVLNLAYFFLFK